MNNMHEETDKFKELFRRVETTCKSRYNASRRLQWQHRVSQWTIALLSLSLIIIPVLRLADVQVGFAANYITVMQIVFAALVLVYSLLIGTENFAQRSEKLHRCGLELGRLARRLKPFKEGEEANLEDYEKFQSRYYDILEKYENHNQVDFLLAQLDLRERYYPGRFEYLKAFSWAWCRYALGFLAHAVVIGILLIWMTFMIAR